MPDQHEGADSRLHEAVCLSRLDSNPFVVAEDDPIMETGFCKPIQIVCSMGKVIVVPLEADAGSCEDLEEDTVREICVDEENGIRRRVFRR